ncbi:hypothetical protein ACRS7F_22995 [Brucella anthropi]|uniref:hypothetical protein n=1 Tax=Brucella anthropi TaxID=529 RepID=UPI003EE39CE0
MSPTETITRPREERIDPELRAMLDYFGDRVESVTIEYKAKDITSKATIRVTSAPKGKLSRG